MKQLFICLIILATQPAYSALISVEYAHEYLGQICHNEQLYDTPSHTDNLASKSYILSIIDELNKNNTDYFSGDSTATSYVLTLNSDSLASLGYLKDIAKINKKIEWAQSCCMDGVFNTNTNECNACGTWTRDNDASKCPDGWTHIELNAILVESDTACPADTMPYFKIPDACENNIF